jgi:hypothetical protein
MLTSCVRRISIASVPLVFVVACTAFDVPEPKQTPLHVDIDQTEGVSSTDASAEAASLQADAAAPADAAPEAAAPTCGVASSGSFCISDVLHQCSSTGENVIDCGKLQTKCVPLIAGQASCQ